MKKVYHVLILLFILPLYVSAQQKTISGKVSDPNGAVLQGATVSVNSGAGTNGVATDINGQYSISVPANTTELIFSFVGMKDVIEKINGRSVINISMTTGND